MISPSNPKQVISYKWGVSIVQHILKDYICNCVTKGGLDSNERHFGLCVYAIVIMTGKFANMLNKNMRIADSLLVAFMDFV